MFQKITHGIARDEQSREVQIEGRFEASLRLPGGEIYLVGLDKDDAVIELMSGEVTRVAADGGKLAVSAEEKAHVLPLVRDGLAVLSDKTVTIPV